MSLRPRGRQLGLLVAAALVLPTAPSPAQPSFSVSATSPSAALVDPGAVLTPGPGGGPPAVAFSSASLGLLPTDEVNAMTSGGTLGGAADQFGSLSTLHFSVDPASAGDPFLMLGAPIVAEALAGQAAADVFLHNRGSGSFSGAPAGGGPSTLTINQDALGLLPATAPGVPAASQDDVDALDLGAALPIAFALAAGHPYAGTGTGCGGDLFAPGLTLAHAYTALGLTSCADDVDALHIDTSTGDIYYSLTPGSPSLQVGSSFPLCAAAGCSGADLFRHESVSGTVFFYREAAALGLFTSDDVDALAWGVCTSPSGNDTDGDLVDDACDNCVGLRNAEQGDTNADGYGNICDVDFDNDGVIGNADFGRLRNHFGCNATQACFDADFDANLDGIDGKAAFVIMRNRFGGAPGPSGLPCAGTPGCTFP